MFLIRVEGPDSFVVEAINPAQQATIGADVIATGKRIDELLPQQIADQVIARYAECVRSGEPMRYEEEGIFRNQDGFERHGHWLTLLVPIHDGGRLSHLFGISQDLTELYLARAALEDQKRELEKEVGRRTAELTELNRQLSDLASKDPLTGVYNRRHLHAVAGHEIQRARRRGSPLSLLMMDLNDFKTINDHFGHAAGDDVLRAVARILLARLRETDVLARYGGDEFVVLLPDTAQDHAATLGRRISEAIRQETPGNVGISFGLASLETREDTLDRLIERADSALLDIKQKKNPAGLRHNNAF
ncbi:MAG: GGDEF domain-containing protein [Ectothiorhodospiraceae bacterium]|nr:GGDEF domain-containing protein [Ectothiorhodospiraceae bacterium]